MEGYGNREKAKPRRTWIRNLNRVRKYLESNRLCKDESYQKKC